MKKIMVLTVFLFIGIMSFAQVFDNDPTPLPITKYTFELLTFYSNSGFSPATSLNFGIVSSSNKNGLGLGFFFDNETSTFSGLNMNLFWFLGKSTKLRPYIFYDIIFRRSHVNEPMPNGYYGDLAAYNSVEHHIGLGVKLKLSNKFYLKTSFGPGFYLGSIEKPKGPDPRTLEMYGSNGFGYIMNFALGYSF